MKFLSEYDGPWANTANLHTLNTGEWRFQRPVIAKEKCKRCNWCSVYCPVGCIEKSGKNLEIGLHYCKGCGICERICPHDAITMIPEE